MLDQYGGVEEVEGATSQARSQIGLCSIRKGRLACLKVYGTARPKVLGGLQVATLLSIEDLYRLHIVEGILAEVYLPILRIAQLHTIVKDTDVVSTHAAYVDGLESTDPAEVLDLNA